MAGRAIDIEAFLPTLKYLHCDWKWKDVHQLAVRGFTGIEPFICYIVIVGNCSGNDWLGGGVVGKKLTGFQRFIAWLIAHGVIGTTKRDQQSANGNKEEPGTQYARTDHFSTSETAAACKSSKNARVCFKSNLGSFASMARKKRSSEARPKAGTLKTG